MTKKIYLMGYTCSSTSVILPSDEWRFSFRLELLDGSPEEELAAGTIWKLELPTSFRAMVEISDVGAPGGGGAGGAAEQNRCWLWCHDLISLNYCFLIFTQNSRQKSEKSANFLQKLH